MDIWQTGRFASVHICIYAHNSEATVTVALWLIAAYKAVVPLATQCVEFPCKRDAAGMLHISTCNDMPWLYCCVACRHEEQDAGSGQELGPAQPSSTDWRTVIKSQKRLRTLTFEAFLYLLDHQKLFSSFAECNKPRTIKPLHIGFSSDTYSARVVVSVVICNVTSSSGNTGVLGDACAFVSSVRALCFHCAGCVVMLCWDSRMVLLLRFWPRGCHSLSPVVVLKAVLAVGWPVGGVCILLRQCCTGKASVADVPVARCGLWQHGVAVLLLSAVMAVTGIA